MTLLAVGSIALDSIETPFGKVQEVLGGSATHFAAAASFFSPVRLVGVVGQDFPKNALQFLEKRGVELDGVEVASGKTFRWEGRYRFDLNNAETRKTELGVFANFLPSIPEGWKNPDHLFLGNIHPSLQKQVLERVGKAGKVSLDTMNLWIESERKGLEEVIRLVDLVVINEGEARQFAKESSLAKAARQISSLGPRTVVIKRGEYGALLFYKGELFSAPGLPLEVVKDPTGAGDSFAGGMIGFLAREKRFDFETLKKGVMVGSAMASLNVEDFGVNRLKELDRSEIGARVEEFKRLSSFGDIKV